jgi:beta-glucosidase
MSSRSRFASGWLLVSTAGLVVHAACSMEPAATAVAGSPDASLGGSGGASAGAGGGGAGGVDVGGSGGGGGAGGIGTGGSTSDGGSGGTNAGGSTADGGPSGAGGADGSVVTGPVTAVQMPGPIAPILTPTDPEATKRVSSMIVTTDAIPMLSGGVNAGWDFDATGVPSLNIPAMPMRDGPRGVRDLGGGQTTTWAVAEARAASFDLDMEERVGVVHAEEMYGLKYDVSLAPVINTLRNPRWARAQETYGEDPVLLGEMGAAFTRGLQKTRKVQACPKHWVGNDVDDLRTSTQAQVDEQTLRENYAKPFEITVKKADPACIMAAYNGINGSYCAENKHVMTDILRTEWKWAGYVVSDWWATKGNGALSLMAGLDLEMPDNTAFKSLAADLAGSRVTAARIQEAATRVLNARIKFGLLDPTYSTRARDGAVVNDAAHRTLASETELKGAVLLKNTNILPIGANATAIGMGSPAARKIAIVGPDNAMPTGVVAAGQASGLGDRGSSGTKAVQPVVSFAAGLKTTARAAAGITVTQSADASAAAGADIVIIPVTMAHEDEGEAYDNGADRKDMLLSGVHPKHWAQKPAAFIDAVAAVNKNIVVLLAFGSVVVKEPWMDKAMAIVQTWYPGEDGGEAAAKLLLGEANFSGKLPITMAATEADYPAFQNTAATVKVDYLHGYRRFEKNNTPPLYWFGHGLSYTTYEYGAVQVASATVSDPGNLVASVPVTNKGSMDGDEVVQLYIGYPKTAAPAPNGRPIKELKAFARVALKKGETKTVQFTVPTSDMAYWNMTQSTWVVEKVSHKVYIGPSADPAQLKSADFTIQ